ncbi:hypothetical protein T01_14848 [Trichinella spiralis]|uniref:Uncharacterized protein n=1 Tax=Trichinella spiralis TaxID=6334 RepID=A0A0V1AIN3_TRISP|nr:hypothetical protein T01_14848 [Trichinella spiralis]
MGFILIKDSVLESFSVKNGFSKVWYYSVPLFSHWSLPTLFYWTVKS